MYSRPDEVLISLKDTMLPLHEETHKKSNHVVSAIESHKTVCVCCLCLCLYIYEKDGETDNPCHSADKENRKNHHNMQPVMTLCFI